MVLGEMALLAERREEQSANNLMLNVLHEILKLLGGSLSMKTVSHEQVFCPTDLFVNVWQKDTCNNLDASVPHTDLSSKSQSFKLLVKFVMIQLGYLVTVCAIKLVVIMSACLEVTKITVDLTPNSDKAGVGGSFFFFYNQSFPVPPE